MPDFTPSARRYGEFFPSPWGSREDREALDRIHARLILFSEKMQRPIVNAVPHGFPVNAEDHTNLFANPEDTGVDPTAFTLYWYSTPGISGLRITSPAGGMGTFVMRDGSRNRIMLDSIAALTSDEYPTYEAIGHDFGTRVDSPFLGLLDLKTVIVEALEDPSEIERFFYTTDRGDETTHGYLFEDLAIIPYDLIHHRESNLIVKSILSYIHEQYQALSTADPAERAARLEQMRQEAIERKRKADFERSVHDLNHFVESLSTSAIRAAEQEVRRVSERTEERRSQYFSALRDLEHQMATLEGYRQSGGDPHTASKIETVLGMIERGTITAFRRVDSAMFEVDTRTLLVQDDRTDAYHLLGRYTVRINMGNGEIRFMNNDRKVDAFGSQMNHPHVWYEGNACLGNFSEMIAPIVQSKDWFTAISMVLAFLESANTRDAAGQYVHKWPLVEDPTEYGYPAYDNGVPQPYGHDDEPEDEEE